jgi:hypothetical protein
MLNAILSGCLSVIIFLLSSGTEAQPERIKNSNISKKCIAGNFFIPPIELVSSNDERRAALTAAGEITYDYLLDI